MLCRDDGWGWNHHAIWANAGGYLMPNPFDPVLPYAVILHSKIENPWQLWDEQVLDSWTHFKAIHGGYFQPDFVFGGVVFADPGDTLNGNALWSFLF